jgi:hypothetical protein
MTYAVPTSAGTSNELQAASGGLAGLLQTALGGYATLQQIRLEKQLAQSALAGGSTASTSPESAKVQTGAFGMSARDLAILAGVAGAALIGLVLLTRK